MSNAAKRRRQRLEGESVKYTHDNAVVFYIFVAFISCRLPGDVSLELGIPSQLNDSDAVDELPQLRVTIRVVNPESSLNGTMKSLHKVIRS